MNKHTPGPWKTLHRENNRKHELDYWISGREQIIGNVRIADVVTESNARLIASAPELLQALIHVESLFGVLAVEDLPNIPNKKVVEMIQSLRTARDVIEKVTGK